MQGMITTLLNGIFAIRWLDAIDVLLVAFIIYQILLWFKGTKAMQLTKGVLLLLALYLMSGWMGLVTVNWLLQELATILLLALIIVFQPELRRLLERIGRGGPLVRRLAMGSYQEIGVIRILLKAIDQMAAEKTGAILVIVRNTGLSEYIESGTAVDAKISEELLLSIFTKNTPLHDGAVIIEGSRIVAAGCLLPLTESRLIDTRLGTRHRAAIGLTEQTDAIVIVISEEAGIISVAENGILTRYLSKSDLEKKLLAVYQLEAKGAKLNLETLFQKTPKTKP